VRNLTRHPLRKLFLIKSSIYCEFLLILGSYAQFSKSLSCCFSGRPSSEKWDFSSMFQSNLDLPLNNKSVHNNLLELLPKFGNFGGHRFRIMNFFDSQPPNLRHDFMRTHFEFRHIFAPCANDHPKCYSPEDQTSPFCSLKFGGKFETFSRILCMQHSFIVVKTYPCVSGCIWF
jgi:hypothetical protein